MQEKNTNYVFKMFFSIISGRNTHTFIIIGSVIVINDAETTSSLNGETKLAHKNVFSLKIDVNSHQLAWTFGW